MIDTVLLLISLAEHASEAATLFYTATQERCRSCVAEISDLNRQTLSELADIERAHHRRDEQAPLCGLRSAHRLANCVHSVFSAAMLLPEELPLLPPLCEIAACNKHLATYPRLILEGKRIDFFSMHTAANKGRGAHALLLSNYCSTDGGRRLLPLALATERHRDTLEAACEQLLLELG